MVIKTGMVVHGGSQHLGGIGKKVTGQAWATQPALQTC